MADQDENSDESEPGSFELTEEVRQRLAGTQFFVKVVAVGATCIAAFGIVRQVNLILHVAKTKSLLETILLIPGDYWSLVCAVATVVIAILAWRYAHSMKRIAHGDSIEFKRMLTLQNSMWFWVFVLTLMTILIHAFFWMRLLLGWAPERPFF